ncbi:MAG: nitrate/nitrite transporter NrtS [Bacteroidota bacterium]|nr:nitrate/nitrite transporter NrtS [Bacteroidota bacterium]
MENTKPQQPTRKLAIEKKSLKRALRVAILVGVILNVINNPGLITFSFTGLNTYKVLLTFLVPFCVSLYSSILANRKKCPEQI